MSDALSLCSLVTCVLGAVAGTQLCCALDIFTNLFASFLHIFVPCPRLVRIRPGGMREAIRRPARDGVLDSTYEVLQILLLISFRILLLRGSCLPPPKSSPRKPRPTPSSAAICGAGASWRLLGPKNRVPRGLQKLIKFRCHVNIDF